MVKLAKLSDLWIESITPLDPPERYLKELPVTRKIEKFILQAREEIVDIIRGKDSRLLSVVGPCSIHDEKAGLEYAKKIADLARQLRDRIFIVMRVYFEKPRTTVGWKGFIFDPDLDGSFKMEKGLYRARALLLEIAKIGLPAATEFVDPFTPQYIADLVSWAAIGARTVESQTHRQMASGLSMPVAFKNSTSGNVQVAIDAIISAQSSHPFLGIDRWGKISIVITKGNPYCHLILRGGESGPNYDQNSIAQAIERLRKANLPPYLMIDCAHGNSQKDHHFQPEVFWQVMNQRLSGNLNIIGLMLESNLFSGSQSLDKNNLKELKYGVSITDPCLGWSETEKLLKEAYQALG